MGPVFPATTIAAFKMNMPVSIESYSLEDPVIMALTIARQMLARTAK
jgi:hypothetical protein